MSEQDFDRLLNAMPKIAEAVKDLPEDLKPRAFEELINTFRGRPAVRTPRQHAGPMAEDEGTVSDEQTEPEEPGLTGGSARRKAAKSSATRKARPRKSWNPDRNIDFWPENKKSFKDFAEEKQPTSLFQKNLIAVYWLEQELGLKEIGVSQVLAAYKAMDWPEPQQPDTSLRNTASFEHWIDTKSTKAITTTPGGRNMVKSMPAQKAKK